MLKHRHRVARWLVRSVCGLAVAVLASACGNGQDDGRLGRSTSAIAGGRASDASQDYGVRVQVSTTKIGKGFASGLLVSPTLVLTGAHVVEGTNAADFFANIGECTLNATPAPPDSFTVTVGSDWTTGTVYNVKRVFVDTSATDCAHDIAALELDKPVTGVNIPALQLDSPPVQGTAVTDIGFGTIDDQGTATNQRQAIDGTIILTGGGSVDDPGGGGSVPVPAPYFVVNASGCVGDSGGPIMDQQGNAIGYDEASTTNEVTSNSTCEVTDTIAIPYSANVSFIEKAFQAEGLMPHRAGQPPPADIGGTCTIDNQCNSNYCVQVGGQGRCSKACSADADCPASISCTDTGRGFSVCLAPEAAPTPPSCSATAPGRDSEGGAAFLAVFALSFAIRRRRPLPDSEDRG